MVTTLTGENSFGWSDALKTLISTFIEEYGEYSVIKMDGEEASFDEIQRTLISIPLLTKRQCIILRSPSKNKQFLDSFELLLSEVPDSSDVVIVEPKLDKRMSYYKYLKKQTEFKEFPELSMDELVRWAIRYTHDDDATISNSDARYLIDRIGFNQQQLSQELDKQQLYSHRITRETIDLLTEQVPQSTIFQLLDAAFSGHDKTMLELYNQQRAMRVEPQQIIALLAWQLHILAIIKTAGDRSIDQIASQTRINPFVIRRSQNIAKKLSLNDLKTRILRLSKIDARLKRTSINGDEVLQQYLLTLASAQ